MSKKKAPKNALERIAASIDEAEKMGLPKEALVLTILSVEIQRLENKVEEMEGNIEELQNKVHDLENLPAEEFPRGEFK